MVHTQMQQKTTWDAPPPISLDLFEVVGECFFPLFTMAKRR